MHTYKKTDTNVYRATMLQQLLTPSSKRPARRNVEEKTGTGASTSFVAGRFWFGNETHRIANAVKEIKDGEI